MTSGSFRDRMRSGASRTNSFGTKPKEFYCTVFGQMDKSQTNLAVVLRTYFYPKEVLTGAMKHVEERWDDNASFKIICNHEVNSDPPSVMLCNPVSVKAKPGAQFRIDLLNQEAFLDTAEFFTDGPQLPKCLQFDISLESYHIGSADEGKGLEHLPAIKIIRSPDESQVASIPLVHLCDIPDAAMTGSFAFDDFCYTVDPKPRFGLKVEHNRTWHRLPQLLVRFISDDRSLAGKVMDIAKEWENQAGLQLIHIPRDSDREAQIRIKFAARNESAIGTDAEDVPDDRPTMHLNVSRDTHPVLFRRRVLHQFGHALGLCHEFELLPESVEWDEAGVQLDTSMEAGWTTEQTKAHVFNKKSCSNNDTFDRLSIMTQTFKRSYVKGWLPRQHQSVLSVDDKRLIKTLYPPPTSTHQWADPLASPEPEEESEEEETEDEEEEMTEWKRAAMEREREDATPIDMFSGVFSDKGHITDTQGPPTPPASVDRDGFGRRHRSQHHGAHLEFEPTDSGKKRVSRAASLFEDSKHEQMEAKKSIAIRPGTDKSFLAHAEAKYTKEEIDKDIRDGDFFSFRDQAAIREMELPTNDRQPTPLFSPPDTPDSIPDSLAASPVSKLFLSDTFMDIREDWLSTNQEHMIMLTQESVPGTRKQKTQLHPGDIRYTEGGDHDAVDFKGRKIQEDTYGNYHKEKELFEERTNVISPSGLVEREGFYRTLGKLGGEKANKEEEIITFAEKMERIKKEQNKQEEFFEPTREYVGEADIQGMGFDAPETKLRVEYEPDQKPKKGKGKGKKKKNKLKDVKECDESFYNQAFRKAQEKEHEEEDPTSFRDKLKNREYQKAPISSGLNELQPVDEDIFDLLDRTAKESGHFNRGKFIPPNNAPALISTKGSFAGIGGSGAFRESGWQSYYDYAEEDMMGYEYQETQEDEDMDLLTFRERLQKRCGVEIHDGVAVSAAGADARNYLESPVPVANRTNETEERIKNKMLKNKAGRYYDDEIDLVSPNHLVDEALDRGFGRRAKDQDSDDDEISREKKAAARKHYGLEDDDVARTKAQIKADNKSKADSKSHKSQSPSDSSFGGLMNDAGFKAEKKHFSTAEERQRYGFNHTVTYGTSEKANHQYKGGAAPIHGSKHGVAPTHGSKYGSAPTHGSKHGTGHHDTGHHGTGHHGTGHHGSGHHDTGHHGTDHHGTGHHGTGHHDTGHHDTGHHGTGHHGTDHHGTGHHGTGHHGTGHHGTGHHGTGHHDSHGTSFNEYIRGEDYSHSKQEATHARHSAGKGDVEESHVITVDHHEDSHGHQSSPEKHRGKSSVSKRSGAETSESIEADLNWNLDRTHTHTVKSRKSASAFFEKDGGDDESPFLPPIEPKKQHKPTGKSFVLSKEIATQITADALIPTQPIGDYWVNKDTVIAHQNGDPYADLALKMDENTMRSSQRFYSGEERPATYRSTFTAYEPPSETYEKPKFECLTDEEDDEQPDVYSRLTDAKAYKSQGTGGAVVDVWTEKTDISFTVLLYLKKNLGINWKRAGQYLGVSRERLRRIEDIGIASARTGIEKMAQDMLFEWAEKDPQPTVAKLCAALEAADLSKLAQGVHDKVRKENQAGTRRSRRAGKGGKPRTRKVKVDDAIKVPVSEETIPYRVMVYLKDNLGESWKDVAVCLKVPSPRIKAIEADAWQVEKMAYDMLHEWRQREKEAATVDKLIDALERAQCKKLVKGVQARSQSYHFRIAH